MTKSRNALRNTARPRPKVAAAVEKMNSEKLLFDLAEAHLAEMENKALLTKGKG